MQNVERFGRREGDGAERGALKAAETRFPFDKVANQMKQYANAEAVWAQEEPKNMGYWAFVAPRIATTMRISRALNDAGLRFIGRPPSAAPATGSLAIHNAENSRIIAQALDSSDDAVL